jgi:hypothetical protein
MTWDGMFLWMGDDLGVIRGFDIVYNEEGYQELIEIGNFQGPIGTYTSIAWDGSAFMMRHPWDSDVIMYRVDYDGSILGEYSSPPEVGFQTAGLHYENGALIASDGAGNFIYNLEMVDELVLDGVTEGSIFIVDTLYTGIGGNSVYDNLTVGSNIYLTDWSGQLGVYDISFIGGGGSVSPSNGSIAPGESQVVSVSMDLGEEDIFGVINTGMMVENNDPDNESLFVPIGFEVSPP